MAQYIIDRPTATWGAQTIFGGSAGLTMSPQRCVINVTGDEQDTTRWTGSAIAARSKLVGLRQWTATFTGLASTPTMGNTGLITATGFSVAFAKGWDMAIACEPKDTTYFSGAPTYRSFIPGLLSASGSFDTDADSANALALAPSPATGTFRIADTATDHTIAATIAQLSISPDMPIGELATANCGFITSGDLTLAGSGGFIPILGTGTLAVPTAASLVITSTTSRTYTGSAFWSSVRIRVSVSELIQFEATFQGSGTLTEA